jgi:nucleotidyltransferase/DNA polymerase involved in DNA repair
VTRTLLYAEVPGFYAAVERSCDPALADRPVIVGGDPRKRGLVQAATEDALAAGVRLGMPVLDALERCPRARALRTRMPFYREAAVRLRARLRQVADALEPDGLEAVFLDASDGVEAPEVLAGALREAARAGFGLPLRVGIAPVRILAKIAAGEAGAAGILRIQPGDEARFLEPLAVGRLPFIGPNAELRLAQAGARRVGEALALGETALEGLLGNRARELVDLAAGKGEARVRAERAPRSLSQEVTLEAPERAPELLQRALGQLVADLEGKLKVQGLGARRIALKLRYDDQQTVTRSQTLSRSIAQRAEIEAAAFDLLTRTEAGLRPVRLVGLVLGRLVRGRRDPGQLDLFPPRR